MKLYSKRPNCVIIAVLALSASATVHLVIPLDEVQLAEDRGAVEVVGEVLHVGQSLPVGGGDLVEAAVVAAGPPSASWLGYHVEGGGPGRGRAPHNT